MMLSSKFTLVPYTFSSDYEIIEFLLQLAVERGFRPIGSDKNGQFGDANVMTQKVADYVRKR